MNTETTTKNVAYYESLPYTVTIRKDEEGDFVARVSELPGCVAHGETESVAIDNLRSVQKLWIEEALSAGEVIPEPEVDTEMPSGKWVQRVPKRLHKELVDVAKRDNVSLNQLVTSMLSAALAERKCAHALEFFLARMPQPMHQMRDAFIALWHPGDAALRPPIWATGPRPPVGSISAALACVRQIGSPETVEVGGPGRKLREFKEQQLGRK